jgi:hypothetical protein
MLNDLLTISTRLLPSVRFALSWGLPNNKNPSAEPPIGKSLGAPGSQIDLRVGERWRGVLSAGAKGSSSLDEIS